MRFLKTVLVCSIFFGCLNFLIGHFGEPMPVPGPESKTPPVIPDVFTHVSMVIQRPSFYLADALLPHSLNENVALLVVSILSGAGCALIWTLCALIWRQIRRPNTKTDSAKTVAIGITLCLALVLCGCTSTSSPRLAEQRRQLSAAYQDTQRPMAERVKAFDDLLETFANGTREEVIDKYVNYGCFGIDRKAREGGDSFTMHLHAPDESERHIPMIGDKVKLD